MILIKNIITRVLAEPEEWNKIGGGVMDCDESVIVLRESLQEIEIMCQEALEDAILMDVSEHQFREVLQNIIKGLENPYHNLREGK
jgi:hypothetical protein